ncbi:hypothetical protein NU688_31470 [Variovorax sp. ZS18.2.2]|uniref:hypothetical protein n=1 Tax=Variovorax sp. ZS18.2.2 TaxID=2971255 RepID=UPI002151D466|nr:hypothetical protein [Variovorax sp. ZS18.2.2]MCR6480711.1 hypothetical protein [Variovorax sp. ZS18.2.2]
MKTMLSFSKSALVALVAVVTSSAFAILPPPHASSEEVLCRATLVAIGISSDFRLVRSQEIAGACQPFDPDATSLDLCTSVEATVKIETVIYSKDRAPPSSIQFRFGGGFFMTGQLRNDLEGKRMIFHVVPDPEAPPGTYKTSYPWRLGMEEGREDQVRGILEQCHR